MVFAFLAIAAAISVNAIHFQTPVRPGLPGGGKIVARIGETVPETEPASKPARPLVTAAIPGKTPMPPAQATPALEPQASHLVRAIQGKLAHFGYKGLPQDGIPGPDTRAAILAAEFEQGLPLTGEPSEDILKALVFLEASGRNSLGTAERFERDGNLVKAVQALLAKMGDGQITIDGRLDAATRGAIRRFEARKQIKPEGRLTERILLEMVIENGEPLMSKG